MNNKVLAGEVESLNCWTKTNEENKMIRSYKGVIFMKEVSQIFYGGYQIKKVGSDSLLAKEWLGKVSK